MKKLLGDLTKVLRLARGLGNKYKDFRIAILSKAPFPAYNQLVLALKAHETAAYTGRLRKNLLNLSTITKHSISKEGEAEVMSPIKHQFPAKQFCLTPKNCKRFAI